MNVPPAVLQSMLKALGVTPEAVEGMAKSIAKPIGNEIAALRAQLNRIEEKLDILLDHAPDNAIMKRDITEGFDNVRSS